MCSTFRSSARITAIFFESGDQRSCGRTGCGRCSWLGRGMVLPYPLYSTPSVVSCTESLCVSALRTQTLFFEMNASSFLSGDFTNGTSLGNVSLTVHLYIWILQLKRLRTALNSISLSLSPSFANLKVWNGSLLPSNAVSDADVIACASFT